MVTLAKNANPLDKANNQTKVGTVEYVHALAAEVAGDEDINEVFTASIKAGDTTKRTSYVVMTEFHNVWGDKMLDVFPKPVKDAKSQTPVQNPCWFKDDDGEDVDFYTIFAKDTDKGVEIAEWKEALRLGKQTPRAAPAPFDGSDDAYPNYNDMGIGEMAEEGKRLDAAFNVVRNSIRKAINLAYQLSELQSMEKISVTFTDNERSTTPIHIHPVGQPGKVKAFSAGQILGFNVEEAKAKGGTMAALEASSGKGSQNTKTGISIKTSKDFEVVMAAMAQYVERIDKAPALGVAALKALTAKDADALRQSFITVVSWLEDLKQPVASASKVEHKKDGSNG